MELATVVFVARDRVGVVATRVAPMDSVCVFCGSSSGVDTSHAVTAKSLGRLIAEHRLRLVYGGGAVGLMGILADAALRAGAEVVGVIPRGLFRREVNHRGLTDLVEVDSMHQRKQVMFELSDAFVALPGGLGTVEELAEILTWAQLGLHRKPIATLGVAHFWQPWHDLLAHLVAGGFLRSEYAELVVQVERVEDVLPALRAERPAPRHKWIDLAET